MPLSSEGATRSFRQNVTLTVLLALVAGAVNVAGFMLVGEHTSHTTGRAAAAGEALALGDYGAALAAAQLLAAFVGGAATAALVIDLSAAYKRTSYTFVLALEAGVLALSALWASREGMRAYGLGSALCFAMGMQNAMVTRISGAVVRTTHLTGVMTDFGIECVRIVRWAFTSYFQRAPDGSWRAGPMRQLAAQLERALLHVALALSFLGGAMAGPILVRWLGGSALAAPAAVLVALIVLDRRPGAAPS